MSGYPTDDTAECERVGRHVLGTWHPLHLCTVPVPPPRSFHTVIVAFTVEGDTFRESQEVLTSLLPRGGTGVGPIDSWWVAEDERYDGSDNDSAIFVPMGTQAASVSALQHQ